ncbi:MAG TPA: glycosyltransferase family 4 protein [Chloroflexia bacterium]|nr:glycosyltransferase family 4 protein [Chloroflexia bacterium]
MRIALLAPFGLQPKGTVQARILPLAHALAQRGHQVRVVIPPWDDPAASANRFDRVELAVGAPGSAPAGVHIVTLPLPARIPASAALTYGLIKEALNPSRRRFSDSTISATAGQNEAVRSLATFHAEVVHVFKPVGYTGLAGFALGALRVPWVLDVDDWEGRGGWADVNPYTPAQKLSITLMEALLPRLARGVTAAGRTLEARAWDMGLARSRVTYLPNGVWRDKYGAWAAKLPDQDKLRETLGLGGRPTILLYTRFDVFPIEWPLTILKQIVAEQPDAALLVVGEGLRGEEKACLDHAEHMGLRDNMVMPGYVQGDTLPTYLSLGDVGIYPMQDTLLNRAKSPMKVLEPMLMGIPLVAHRVGQAAEFVGGAGVLVQPGDLPGMATATLSLLRDPTRRVRLGQYAQVRVWDCFNWENLSEQAEAAYERALGKLV